MRYCMLTATKGSGECASIVWVLCILAAPRLKAPPGINTDTGSFFLEAVWPRGLQMFTVKQSSDSVSGPSRGSSRNGTSCFPGHLIPVRHCFWGIGVDELT